MVVLRVVPEGHFLFELFMLVKLSFVEFEVSKLGKEFINVLYLF